MQDKRIDRKKKRKRNPSIYGKKFQHTWTLIDNTQWKGQSFEKGICKMQYTYKK